MRILLRVLGSLLVLPTQLLAAQENPKIAITPQLGHGGFVNSVALSPDSKAVLSASDDRTIKLWDTSSGREIKTFRGHTGSVLAVAFFPDGRTVLSGSSDETLKVWDVVSGRELKKFEGRSGAVKSIAFSRDGKLIVTGGCEHANEIGICRSVLVKLWDVATSREIKSFNIRSVQIESVAFSLDGTQLLTGGCDKANEEGLCTAGAANLWDVSSGRLLKHLNGYPYLVETAVFSPDGQNALVGGWGPLVLWDVVSDRVIRTFTKTSEGAWSVVFSPDGKSALSGGSDNTVRLWDVNSGRELKTLTGHELQVTSVVLSPDGKMAISGSFDATLKLWDATNGREIRTFAGRAKAVNSVAFSPDGRNALVAGDNNAVEVIDLKSGRELGTFGLHAEPVTCVVFSRDGKTAFSASGGHELHGAGEAIGTSDVSFRQWDVASQRELRSFKGHGGPVASIALSTDGKTILSGSWDGLLKLWDVSSGLELMTFEGHEQIVRSVALLPDGRTALSGSEDTTLKLWDLKNGRLLKTLKGHSKAVRAIAVAPDGKTALSGGVDKTVVLWDIASGRQLKKFTGHADAVKSIAYSPDGKTALSASIDKTIAYWDLTSGKRLKKLEGHGEAVHSVAISPDQKVVLSGSADGTTRLWNLERGEELGAFLASSRGGQLIFTPSGFFDASGFGGDTLSIVRGIEITTIGQVHQSLFNPDLVREALSGDQDGEVHTAAQIINLEQVLDSGPPPSVIITATGPQNSSSDLIQVEAKVTDSGKGVGRIEWRVNGVTTAVRAKPSSVGPEHAIIQQLALDPGDNLIELTAYDGKNIIASTPATSTITFNGRSDEVKAKLHILAIGINKYIDRGGIAPGKSEIDRFPPLGLAVRDAQAIAEEFGKAGKDLYSEVIARTVLDEEATAKKLDAAVTQIASEIGPRDTFVLYVAAHGYSHQDRFYLIPQDYQGGPDPAALAANAIDQSTLQDWIANKIKAKKAIILLDTCESGALTGGYRRSRFDGAASDSSIGRLHEATGRPVLTAAGLGQAALELSELGHGVFTSALIDSLYRGDANSDGTVSLSELVLHTQNLVPKLIRDPKERAEVIRRGSTGNVQSARFGGRGEDFSILRRLN